MIESKTALIGYTGFVGSVLLENASFTEVYNSKNITDICGKRFSRVICAGIQAKKWWANQNPDADLQSIKQLLGCLNAVEADSFVLISTVDVYPNPANVTESFEVGGLDNHAYGKNRWYAEDFIKKKFPKHLILRLPGLFGNGLKKNAIYDLLNNNEVDKLNPKAAYQYYYLHRLWEDIHKALELDLKTLNIATEPITTEQIVRELFPKHRIGNINQPVASYDMKSDYWRQWGSDVSGYLYGRNTIMQDLNSFVVKMRSS
jgi:nucleoside-diphosphate-sugar epimerase